MDSAPELAREDPIAPSRVFWVLSWAGEPATACLTWRRSQEAATHVPIKLTVRGFELCGETFASVEQCVRW